MRLSSNWLELQKDELSKNSTNKTYAMQKPKTQRISKYERPKKTSKIMEMIKNVNNEIEEIEKGKQTSEVDIRSENTELKLKLSSAALQKGSRINKIGKYIAIDCEFVGVGINGTDSALARVSLVNFFGHVILDAFVKPQEKVSDWRTWVSGVKPSDMAYALEFSDAQKKVSNILKDRILIGHAVIHDLESLLLSHPKSLIRDTSKHTPFREKYAKGKTPSLKKLVKEILNIDIQETQHSSVDDARATMLIYRSDKIFFEKLHQAKFSKDQ